MLFTESVAKNAELKVKSFKQCKQIPHKFEA